MPAVLRKPSHCACAAAAVWLAALGLGSAAHAQARLTSGGGQFAVSVTSMRDIPFRTVVRQQYDYSCGSAALATLLHYHYGRPVTEAAVFNDMFAAGDQPKIKKVGFSLLDMKRHLERQGLSANGYRSTVAQLERSAVPGIGVISLNGYRHFVVIKGVKDGKVLVGDPALGLKSYSTDEFSKLWNGVIFAIDPASTRTAAFNREEEWLPWAVAPLGERLSNASLAAFTRELPPVYQVSVSISGNLPGR